MPLTEEKRLQLDGIVNQMIQNNEPDENVKFVINDFKGKYEGLLSPEQRTEEFGGIYKSPPKWTEPVKTSLETLGLVGGGALGTLSAPVAGPFTPAVSAVTAGAGYELGKKAHKGLMDILGIETSPYAHRTKPETPLESMGTTAKGILEGAQIEMGGQVTGKIGSAVATPIKQFFKAPFGTTMSSPESQELARIYKEFNIPGTASDLMPSSKTLSIAEGVLGYRPVSGDVMLKNALKKIDALNNARLQLINRKDPSDTIEIVGNRIRKEAEAILSKYTDAKGQKLANMVDDFTSKMGISGKYDVGKRFTETMIGARQVRHDIAENLFNKEREMLPMKGDDIVPLSDEVVNLSKDLVKRETSKPTPLQNKELLGILKAFGGGEAKLPQGVTPWEMAKDPELRKMVESQIKPELTWNGMKETRSDLLERISEIYKARGEPTKAAGMYTALEKAIDRNMETFAEKQGGDIWKTHLSANKATREMHEIFDKDILKIMRSNPEDILNRIVNKGEVTLLKQIRTAAGEDALIPLRQGFFKQTLDSSTSNGILNPTKLGNSLKKMGTETLSELATPQQLSILNKIVKSGEYFSTKQAGMKTVEFIETLSKADPSKIVDVIIKPNNTYNVKLAKKLLTPERLQEVSSAALEKVFKMSGTGNYLPVSSMKAWTQYDAPMKELLPPQTYNAVTDFLKGGQNMARVETLAKNASQTGQVLLGSQVGAAVLGHPLSIAKLLVAPWMIAKMYVNPKSQAFLTRALKLDPVSPEAISLFTKAVTIAGLNLKGETSPTKGISTLPPGIGYGVEKPGKKKEK